MPKFEVFDPRATPRVKEPFVTLQRKGVFSLNRAANALLGEPTSVELLYDTQARIVGFRPVDSDAPTAYAVQTVESGSSFLVAGTRFLAHYDIDHSTSTRWPAYLDGGVLCINLSKDGQPVERSQGRTRLEEIASAGARRRRQLPPHLTKDL